MSLTLDVWADRQAMAYIGVTAHYVSPSSLDLQSSVIAVDRFKGWL